MASLQEQYHSAEFDYRHGSPHLYHPDLYDSLVERTRAALRRVANVLPLDVLEVGAGHGGFTEPVLALGATVTAVEMSRPSLEYLNLRFGCNDRFHGVFDREGDLAGVSGEFSVLLGVSVLHHIPDYIAFLNAAVNRLRPGGMVITLQDPLWYPRVGRLIHRADRLAYYAWRTGQGNLAQAISTLARRVRHTYDEDNPADMVEYHVVRQGVDEEGIAASLKPRFDQVEILRYWSTQSRVAQRVGSALGIANTFGVIATGRHAGP